MINWAIADSHDRAGTLKTVAKTLLDEIIQTEEGNRTDPETCVETQGSEPQLWALSRCLLCGEPRRVYTCLESRPLTAHYCPNCWELDLLSPDGRHIAHATRSFEKRIKELPPGSKITKLVIAGREIPVDPPVEVGGKEEE